MSTRSKGYHAEQIVKQDYLKNGRTFLHQNWTIRGGEIDLIMQQGNSLCFIEVKAVDHVDDLHDYVSSRKLQTLSRSIQTYMFRMNIDSKNMMPRVDVVFVKDNTILHIFERCTL